MASKKTKPDPKQRHRFIEAAREAGASEDEAVFDGNLKRVVKAKPTKERRKRIKPLVYRRG